MWFDRQGCGVIEWDRERDGKRVLGKEKRKKKHKSMLIFNNKIKSLTENFLYTL